MRKKKTFTSKEKIPLIMIKGLMAVDIRAQNMMIISNPKADIAQDAERTFTLITLFRIGGADLAEAILIHRMKERNGLM